MKKFWFGLYNLLVYLALIGITVIAWFNPRYRNWLKVRRNWREDLKHKIGDDMFWIWFHASSSGEFEDGVEILRRLRQQHKQCKVLVTFFSSSGYEQYKTDPIADAVAYLPLDTKKNARDFYNIVTPYNVIFSRNDVWPNFVEECWRHDVAPYLTSFVCNYNSGFFGFPQRRLYRYTFNHFEGIGTQNEETRELLEEHFGVYNAFQAGNTRNTRILLRAQKEFHDEKLSTFSADHFVVTVGSALKKDVEFILKCAAIIPDVKWIIVPHDPEEFTYGQFMSHEKSKHVVWSGPEEITLHHRFLWLDTVGILAETYKYSQLAWIGGGFDKIGIHNIMEPVARGNYVAFGPNHRNYPDAIYAMYSGFGFLISKPEEFMNLISKVRSGKIHSTPAIPEADARAVDYHLGLMKRESGLE